MPKQSKIAYETIQISSLFFATNGFKIKYNHEAREILFLFKQNLYDL